MPYKKPIATRTLNVGGDSDKELHRYASATIQGIFKKRAEEEGIIVD